MRKLIVREGRYRMLYMVTDLMNAACDSQHDPLDFQSVCPPGTRAQAEAVRRACLAMSPRDPRMPFPGISEVKYERLIFLLRSRMDSFPDGKQAQARRVICILKARCRPVWDARVCARKTAELESWMAVN